MSTRCGTISPTSRLATANTTTDTVAVGGAGLAVDQALDPQQRQRAAAVLQDLLAADQRDLVAANPLEASDQLHRNRELLVGMIAQDQRRLRFLRCRLRLRARLARVLARHLQVHMRGDARDIQNRRDGAVAQDRGAGQAGAFLDVSPQRLDDDFLGVRDTVDHQAITQRCGLHDDDVDRLLLVLSWSASAGRPWTARR